MNGEYKRLNTKARTCMYVKSIIRFVIIGAVFGSALFWLHDIWPGFLNYIMAGIIILALVYTIVSPGVRYAVYKYRLTDAELEVRKGFLIIRTEIIPMERLHKIEVSSGPIYRAFGLNQVKVITAGSDLEISYLDKEVAEVIAERLKNRINEIVIAAREEASKPSEPEASEPETSEPEAESHEE